MLIKDIIVETSITDCKTGKLPRVPVRIPTALDGSSNKAILKELLIEETSVSAQVADQVAYFSTNVGISMGNQNL